MSHNHTYLNLMHDGQVFIAVEWITFVVALGLHLTVLPVVMHLYKTGHTNEFPFWIYAANFINSYGLALYSALSDCTIMIVLNVIGVVIYGVCMLIFITKHRTKLWPLLKLAAMLICALYIRHHVTHVAPPEQHEDFLGSVTMTTTAICLLPPLLHVNHFRRQKSCHGMPVAMSILGFISCICWTVYGKLLDDPYTYLPNITGFIGSFTYLLLSVIYGFPEPHHAHDHAHDHAHGHGDPYHDHDHGDSSHIKTNNDNDAINRKTNKTSNNSKKVKSDVNGEKVNSKPKAE